MSEVPQDVSRLDRVHIDDLNRAAEHRRKRLKDSRAHLVQQQRTKDPGKTHTHISSDITAQPAFQAPFPKLRDRLEMGLKNLTTPSKLQKSPKLPASSSTPVLAVNDVSPSLSMDPMPPPVVYPQDIARRREGYLMSASQPPPGASNAESTKAQWTRHWVVLSQGQLLEYSDWRSGPLSATLAASGPMAIKACANIFIPKHWEGLRSILSTRLVCYCSWKVM